MYEWLKYNTDWLVRQMFGDRYRSVSRLPDYPWWFGEDAVLFLQEFWQQAIMSWQKNTIIYGKDIGKNDEWKWTNHS